MKIQTGMILYQCLYLNGTFHRTMVPEVVLGVIRNVQIFAPVWHKRSTPMIRSGSVVLIYLHADAYTHRHILLQDYAMPRCV